MVLMIELDESDEHSVKIQQTSNTITALLDPLYNLVILSNYS